MAFHLVELIGSKGLFKTTTTTTNLNKSKCLDYASKFQQELTVKELVLGTSFKLPLIWGFPTVLCLC